jgi:hypothetical protein
MNDAEVREHSEDEINRIKNILVDAGISDKRIKMLEPVIENTAWMKVKLDDTRETIKGSQTVIPYDNGGGQKGIRENPLFKGYESLWKSYMGGMDRILNALPKETVEAIVQEVEKPKTMLELVRDRKKA